jgi:hypothetical protein
MTFRILNTADIDAKHAEYLATQKAEILAGKIRVRWSQARCGYEIRSGRNAVLGTPTFVCETDAWAWMEETHGINQTAA